MKRKQQGIALIEALVASAVLGIGLLGATQLTLKALQTGADTRERHAAHLLAQEAMDCAMSGSACPSQESALVQGVRYSRQISVTQRSAGLQDIVVSVQWNATALLGNKDNPRTSRLEWQSSISQVPGWVGR